MISDRKLLFTQLAKNPEALGGVHWSTIHRLVIRQGKKLLFWSTSILWIAVNGGTITNIIHKDDDDDVFPSLVVDVDVNVCHPCCLIFVAVVVWLVVIVVSSHCCCSHQVVVGHHCKPSSSSIKLLLSHVYLSPMLSEVQSGMWFCLEKRQIA